MLKWRDFATHVSGYFSGSSDVPSAIASSVEAGVRARIFLLNQFFSSENEVKKTQARIYAKEGGLACQKSEAMEAAIEYADTFYVQYKNAKKACAAHAGSLMLEMAMETQLAVLVDVIIENHPILGDEKMHCNLRIRQEMQKYLQERVNFELVEANAGQKYSVPYVSPDTVYAVMTAAHRMVAAKAAIKPRHRRSETMMVFSSVPALPAMTDEKVEMPTFSNTVGGWIANPAYWLSSLLNGASKLFFEYPARGLCWGINACFGKAAQNSVLATGLKTVLAGPLIALRSVSFGIAKLFSPGGLKETARDAWSVLTNKSARAVADSSPVGPVRRGSGSQFPVRSVAMNALPGYVRQISISEKNSNRAGFVAKEASSSNSAYFSLFSAQPVTPSYLSSQVRASLDNSPAVDRDSPPSSFNAATNAVLQADKAPVSRLLEGLQVSQPLTPRSARNSVVRIVSHRRALSENPVMPEQQGLEAISEMASLHAFSKRRFAFVNIPPVDAVGPQLTIVAQDSVTARP
jgi:hypothetical protein